MIELLQQPWPWWAAGMVIGLTVPTLLIIGNKHFGLSSSLRHTCAACFPGKVKFFQYNWKKESWNLFFVAGILIGGFVATTFLKSAEPIQISSSLKNELSHYGVTDFSQQIPVELFSWSSLFSMRGFLLIIVGGFLVGFGSRYAGGCTSGHAIMGLSNLQFPSLIATLCFLVGGIIMANFILPLVLSI